ncbi:MAG: hypothetical protein L0Z53_11395, partial [Acidobacteriales bacterium]|nr:hypothetical protein [Terriglobales bacterium]
ALQQLLFECPKARWRGPITGFVGLVTAATILFQLHQGQKRLHMDWLGNLAVAGNILLTCVCLYLTRANWPWLRVPLAVGVTAFVLVAGAWSAHCLEQRWHDGYAGAYARFVRVAPSSSGQQKSDRAEICVLQHRYYPFFGSRRQWRVCQPVRIKSPAWLLEYLKRKQVSWVVVHAGADHPGWNQFGQFERCVLLFPERFRQVHAQSGWRLFEFLGKY